MLAFHENVDSNRRKSRSGLGLKVYTSESADLDKRKKLRLEQVSMGT